MSLAQLAPWFQQLRARIPHSVLPANADTLLAQHAPSPQTAVHYSSRVRILMLGPEVTERVETLLRGQLRPESMEARPPAYDSTHQVEAHSMVALLASLVDTLKLPGYSLVILNPRNEAQACAVSWVPSPLHERVTREAQSHRKSAVTLRRGGGATHREPPPTGAAAAGEVWLPLGFLARGGQVYAGIRGAGKAAAGHAESAG
jgi:hypothetical protein